MEPCTSCGRQFKYYSELKAHEQTVHIRNTCNQCQYVSYGSIDLRNHMKTHHLDTSLDRCNQCGKGPDDKTRLKSLGKAHASDKEFVCGKCDIKVDNRANMRSPIETHAATQGLTPSKYQRKANDSESVIGS